MKIVDETKLDFDDILLVPARSPAASRKEVDLKRTYKFFHSPKEWIGLPIMAANMDTTGTFKMGTTLNAHEMITCLHKHYSTKKINDFFDYYNVEKNVWVSIGMGSSEIPKLMEISESLHHSPNICIDIANGYTEKFVGFCNDVRESFPDSIIMAGNVCTPEMVQELILHGGVDIVKIGIGPGSACTTRLKTGVGYPQLSAIIECSHAAHGLKSGERRMGLICADGGCRIPADVCKAFAANADFVMLGGMLAGTDECEGEWEHHLDKDGEWVREELEHWGDDFVATLARGGGVVNIPHEGIMDSPHVMLPKMSKQKKSLLFYGMSSETAQNKHNDGMNSYATSEGRVKKIPYKGPVDNIIKDIEGGLRSCCAYVGATSLKDLPKCAKAVKVNRTHFDKTV
jgi:GMP reductase